MHTKESLHTTLNQLYVHEHGGITESDVDYANIYTTLIKRTRRTWEPVAGDNIIIDGKMYHIDKVEGYTQLDTVKPPRRVIDLSLCEIPGAYVPFIRAKIGDSTATISLSTSGGAWSSKQVTPSQIKLQWETEKRFKFFGSCGACGNGAVEFPAIVNVWEVISDQS